MTNADRDVKLVDTPFCYKQWKLAGNPATFFNELISDFGNFIHYRGLFDMYIANHPELVKTILKDTNQNFDKNSILYNQFRKAFGNGLVVSEGDHWRRQRKLMQPMFSPSAIKQFFEVMLDSTRKKTEQWQNHCSRGEVFNIAEDMNVLTLEIAGRALFNEGFDQVSDKIGYWTKCINHYSASLPLPIISHPHFPLPANLKFSKAIQEFRLFLKDMVDSRCQATNRNDLLSVLLQQRHEESGNTMSESELIEEVLGMIVGGHETSSSALAWTWYELHNNPGVTDKLHEELDRVIGARVMTLEDVPKLKYTRMIVDEVLRLHPPFWFENRNCMNDVELGGALLPKGSMVIFSRYSLHRNPAFWNQPDQFIPERFDDSREENRRHHHAFVPFGGGPRICIGINFAMMELIVVLATIAQRYRVIVDKSDRHEMSAHLTMEPKYGVKVRLEKRS